MADYLQTGISTFKDIITYLTDRSKTKDILRNNLLREMRDNLKLLEHRDKEGVQLSAIIQGLQLTAIDEAYNKNYNFKKLTAEGDRLPVQLILNKRQEKYVGWTADKFIYSIEGKIRDLKNIPALYKDLATAPVNLPVRLDNLFHQLLLLVIFIRSEK